MSKSFSPDSLESLAVTGVNNAALLALSRLPLTEEIADLGLELWAAGNYSVQPHLVDPIIHGPGQELRERLSTRLTRNAPQVLAIGTRLSPEGVLATEQNPGTTYVELDDRVSSGLKKRVVGELVRKTLASPGGGLHLEAGSVLDGGDVARAAAHFDPEQPVTLVMKGLLHYLTKSERAKATRNIVPILRQHPKSVLYTDMPLQAGIGSKDSHMARITAEQTGRSVADHRFADDAEASAFFAAQGLEVTGRHNYADPEILARLTSPHMVGSTVDRVRTENQPWSMYELHAR